MSHQFITIQRVILIIRLHCSLLKIMHTNFKSCNFLIPPLLYMYKDCPRKGTTRPAVYYYTTYIQGKSILTCFWTLFLYMPAPSSSLHCGPGTFLIATGCKGLDLGSSAADGFCTGGDFGRVLGASSQQNLPLTP